MPPKTRHAIDCESCGHSFKVTVKDEDAVVAFCPCCGEDLDREADGYQDSPFHQPDDLD